MIHEILVLLIGENKNFDEDPSIFDDLLHPAEKELVRNILKISAKYNYLLKFVGDVENNVNLLKTVDLDKIESDDENKITVPCKGLYMKAFANGIKKTLQPYREKLGKLEMHYLKNPQLTLSYIYHEMEIYNELFDDLYSMIELVKSEEIYGCQLISRLQKYQHTGKEIFDTSIDIVIKSVTVPFLSQLCYWIIYGNITDNYNEFFISDDKCNDPNFSYICGNEEDGTSSVSTSSSITLLTKTLRIHRPPKIRKFCINWRMVPFFITEEVVETILFIGRIVWILNNKPVKDKKNTKFNDNICNAWDDNEIVYWRKIEKLQDRSLNFFDFSQTIEDCRCKVSKYMLDLFLKDGNIMEHMQLIKDYYAMGRGELFQEFLIAAETNLQDVPGEFDEVNLNMIFLESAKKLYGNSDDSYKKFELVNAKNNVICTYRSGTNRWSWLQLNFEIKWPLHVIFHPQSMEIYNQVFSYLLCFKRTQIHLNKLWYFQVCGKQKIDRKVWTLRYKLMFLINNLFYYLQVDVIEANFSILQHNLKSATEFEDIIKIHHEFVTNLASKTFVLDSDNDNLLNKHKLFQTPAVHYTVPSKIYRIIMKLLELCDDFSLVASTWHGTLTEPEELELEDFDKRSNEIITTLLFSLFNLGKKCGGDHLFQLLDQLNYNQYFVKDSKFNLLNTQNC